MSNDYLFNLKTYIDVLDSAIIIMDNNLKVEIINQYASELMSIDSKNSTGYLLSELLNNNERVIELEQNFNNSVIKNYEIQFDLLNKEEKYSSLNISPIFGEEKDLIHVIVEIKDVSLLKILETEIFKKSNVLNELVYRDITTNLYNHVTISEILSEKLEESIRKHQKMALAIIDIDNFTKINKNIGHRKGDLILSEFAQILLSNKRDIDYVGRYSGNKFLIIYPNTEVQLAYQIVEGIREECQKKDFEGINLTISAGITCFKNESSIDKLIKQANKTLRKAKTMGKNVVVLDENC